MPASTFANSGASFALQEEGGMVIKTINRTPQVDISELANHEGDIIDGAEFKKRAEFSAQGTRTGDTGIGAALVGGLLQIVNELPDFGVSGGQKRVISVPTVGNAEGWLDMTVNGRQYPHMAAV